MNDFFHLSSFNGILAISKFLQRTSAPRVPFPCPRGRIRIADRFAYSQVWSPKDQLVPDADGLSVDEEDDGHGTRL